MRKVIWSAVAKDRPQIDDPRAGGGGNPSHGTKLVSEGDESRVEGILPETHPCLTFRVVLPPSTNPPQYRATRISMHRKAPNRALTPPPECNSLSLPGHNPGARKGSRTSH